jgi:regulator of replication initiation timing
MSEQATIESLEQQLCALYQERDELAQHIGATTNEEIISMIQSLEAQLRDFYERFGSLANFEDAESAVMLSKIQELSNALDPMYSQKSVHFTIENDKPVLRAQWTEATHQGDES